jgi:antitoxin component of MazEF toxin-antitoxin module
MSKTPDVAIQRMLKEIQSTLADHTLRLDRIEEQMVRLADVAIATALADESETPEERAELDELMEQLENLSPEELKHQIEQAAKVIEAEGWIEKKK